MWSGERVCLRIAELPERAIRTPGQAAWNPLGSAADYLRKSQRPRLEGTEAHSKKLGFHRVNSKSTKETLLFEAEGSSPEPGGGYLPQPQKVEGFLDHLQDLTRTPDLHQVLDKLQTCSPGKCPQWSRSPRLSQMIPALHGDSGSLVWIHHGPNCVGR